MLVHRFNSVVTSCLPDTMLVRIDTCTKQLSTTATSEFQLVINARCTGVNYYELELI